MRIVVSTLPVSPSFTTSASIRRLSALKSSSSRLAASLLVFATEVSASACSGVSDGSGGTAAGSSGFLSLPDSMTASPPERILPENAFSSAFCSDSNFDVFTDEMANRTMKRQKSSVIMSANETSQRSSFSCSSSS